MSEEGPPQSQTQSTLSPSQAKSQSQSQPGSSSSSGPTSASQSSSGSGTLSSVDTIPVTLASVPEEPEPQPWGRLLPMVPGFRSHDCIEDQYLFGRDSRCNYVLEDPNDRNSRKFRIYSKKHFRIYREGSEVFVEDLSNNGTFLDGIPIGKDKKLPLVNNAVISLAEQRNRVFVFIDLMSDDQSSLPRDLQEKYLLTRRIGIGVCGEVRLAFERSTCRKFAVKIINKKNFQSEGTATRNAKTEIEILQRVDHPCLIKTEDFYQTEESFYIVLELMEGGELFHRVKSKQQLNESVAKLYFYQMLRAVQYLHSNGIIHRDLKPENILLSSQDDVCLIKVTDFNQSRILEEAVLMRTLCGTPSYLAPEVFTHASTTGYGLAVDAWSLGVLLFVCQRRGEEAAGRRSDEEDEHRGSSAAPLATGPEDAGDGTQAHVPVCRGRGGCCCHGGGVDLRKKPEETRTRRRRRGATSRQTKPSPALFLCVVKSLLLNLV
ncbi:serine/threonine-protein kinase Chk2 isoform X2 [Oreochromis aureus]|uniref:non-specific serine/threonine protein kinase n=1 Tax=Oreochromis aureus TaxID=47969 RepID=A0A668RD06_OREAU|nr:serine/threonine-protein kinase Chk2 isoform X2 [Oreochromis aureus]